MKPRQPAFRQGAKSGGSVSQDEGATRIERSAAEAGRFSSSKKRKEWNYGKETFYF